MSDVEKTFYNNHVNSAPELIELEEEPEEDNQAPSFNEKKISRVKGKRKGMKVVAYASF